MRLKHLRLLALVPALLGLGSCGKSGLSGSVDQFFPLDFSREEILRTRDAFQVTYYKDSPDQIDVVVRLTVVTTGFDWKPGHSFDLSGEYAPGHPRAVVTHAAGGEPARALPPVKQGTLNLDKGGEAGQATAGSFNLSFGEGGDFGNGTTVNGSFDTVATDATPDGGA